MSKTPWTPGPWHAAPGRGQRAERLGWREIRASSGLPVVHAGAVTIWGDGGEQDHDAGVVMSPADATLIAAAPDLYEALERVLAHVTHEETTTASEATKDTMRGIAKFVRAALAKARGETP